MTSLVCLKGPSFFRNEYNRVNAFAWNYTSIVSNIQKRVDTFMTIVDIREGYKREET